MLWLAEDYLFESCYEASIAGLSSSFTMNPAGIVIKLSGFSSKLPILLWMVLEVLLKKPDRKFRQHLNFRFDDIKERLHHRYLAHLLDKRMS